MELEICILNNVKKTSDGKTCECFNKIMYDVTQ